MKTIQLFALSADGEPDLYRRQHHSGLVHESNPRLYSDAINNIMRISNVSYNTGESDMFALRWVAYTRYVHNSELVYEGETLTPLGPL